MWFHSLFRALPAVFLFFFANALWAQDPSNGHYWIPSYHNPVPLSDGSVMLDIYGTHEKWMAAAGNQATYDRTGFEQVAPTGIVQSTELAAINKWNYAIAPDENQFPEGFFLWIYFGFGYYLPPSPDTPVLWGSAHMRPRPDMQVPAIYTMSVEMFTNMEMNVDGVLEPHYYHSQMVFSDESFDYVNANGGWDAFPQYEASLKLTNGYWSYGQLGTEVCVNPNETLGDRFLIPCTQCEDNDEDHICNSVDNCPDTVNMNQHDTDHDGYGDACECPEGTDQDNDNVCDLVDNCPADSNHEQENSDRDELGDVCDPCPADFVNDEDNDGICSAVDNCAQVENSDQLDADNDGLGNVCDTCVSDAQNDLDADGVCGDEDNCAEVSNPDQADFDGDGVGDLCDTPDPDMLSDGGQRVRTLKEQGGGCSCG